MRTGKYSPVKKDAARSFALKAALWILVLLATGHPAFSQLTIGDNANINLSGNAGFGYSRSSGTAMDTISSTDLGFDATLSGFYYNPGFLSFRASPYYNRSRTSSGSSSIFAGKGFDAGMNLFSGGHISGSFGYGMAFDNEQLVNVPGSVANYVARANARNMELNGALNFEGWPSLNIAWGTGSSNATVFGSTMSSSSHSRNFGLNSSYQLWGFSLSGGLSSFRTEQELPDLSSGTGVMRTNSREKTLRLGMTRQLWTAANLSTSLTRNTFTSENGPAIQNGTFDTFSSLMTMRPLSKLNTSIFMTYTTNFGAYLFENLLSATNGTGAVAGTTGTATSTVSTATGTSTTVSTGNSSIPLGDAGSGTGGGTAPTLIATTGEDASNYLDYGTTAAYSFTNRLTATGQASMRRSASRNFAGNSNIVNGGLSYGRPLFGGHIGVNGTISRSSSAAASRSQSRLGESAGVTGGRKLFGWDFNSRFRYQRSSSDNSSALAVTQSGYGWSVSTSHRVVGAWRLQLSTGSNHTRVDQIAASESTSESYSASFSGRKVGVGANYSKTSGLSVQSVGGLIPVDGGSVLPDMNLVTYNGSSYSLSASYHPVPRLNISGDYSHALYSTAQFGAVSSGLLSRYNVRAEYIMRRMRISSGFSRLTQGFGATLNNPATTSTFSIGVSRSFDIF